MKPIRGIKKLPVSIIKDRTPELLMKLTTVASAITRLDEKLKESIVASELVKDPSQKRNVEYFNYNILDLFDR